MKIGDEALLCGIMLGDGCISQYKTKDGRIRYEVLVTMHLKDDIELASRIKILLEKISPNNVRLKKRENRNAIIIQTYSKELLNYMNKKWSFPVGKKGQISIPEEFEKDKELMKKVIAGLFATDGTVIFSKQHKDYRYYPRIEMASKSKLLVMQVKRFLNEEGYKFSTWQNKDGINRLSIHGFESTIKFNKEIGLINPKHKNKFILMGRIPGQLRQGPLTTKSCR